MCASKSSGTATSKFNKSMIQIHTMLRLGHLRGVTALNLRHDRRHINIDLINNNKSW